MQLSNQDAEQLLKEAMEALRQGRPADARAGFETVTGTGRAAAPVWLFQAAACRALNDAAGEESAVDQALVLEARGLAGLIMKGDCRAKAGDERSAVSFYRTALRIASEEPSLPPDIVPELRRAEAATAQMEARYSVQLEASLAAQGLTPEKRSARFQLSLDIVAGRKQVFIQEPTVYFFPGLPLVQFFDTADFAWVPTVEAATDAIRREIAALLAVGREGFRPYIQAEPNKPRMDENRLLDNSDWSALFLCENGALAPDVISRCPATWEAVQAAPLPRINQSAPTAMFSLLRPRSRITPHSGVHNTRLICHLPLIVPPGCGFRVGNEERQWEVGKLLIFDDTIEHEAWNDSAEDRVVLIFDIWRPELSDREKREITALFGAPDAQRVAAGA
ncbi:MAG TPA: aspartyl/asparaginyl beta-hydroxylase domain-containing protein [Allosphingosinicella sp.]|nr:aspartyl/asparaginyl beta-hydroxylase domain-containing protein [Allosphingosinicella sp.]